MNETVGPVLVLAGPTASGKSALAVALAERFGGTVINADSMQLYRELSVLTARPGAAALARAPHRLYGALAAAAGCSVGEWRAMAAAEIGDAHAAGRLPIVAGGTGMYLRALMTGLARIPSVPADIRERARAHLAAIGNDAFHAELAVRDPVMAARLAPGDSQRLARAWEVIEATGRSLANWHREAPTGAPSGWRFLSVLLAPARADLYAACDVRFKAMLGGGAIDEVRALLALGLDPALPAMKALGVREIAAYLAGAATLAETEAAGAQATRRYAKRQATWFRTQMTPDLTLDRATQPLDPSLISAVETLIEG